MHEQGAKWIGGRDFPRFLVTALCNGCYERNNLGRGSVVLS